MPTQDALAKYDLLIARHRGLIIKVCQIYCHRDMELARDLYQDIALKLWTEMDHFRGESSEATWLWHIAVNTAIDKLRHEGAGPGVVLTSNPPEPTTYDHPQQIDDLYEAIAHLPADDQLLVSYRLDGYSYCDIACFTNQSEGSLRVRYSRIIKQLKTMLNHK